MSEKVRELFEILNDPKNTENLNAGAKDIGTINSNKENEFLSSNFLKRLK